MGAGTRPQLFIIGIDGADYLITKRLFAEGLLPNLRSLAERGAWGPIRSTTPPVTPAAWTTLMTGKNPGKHGVYDFLPMSGEAMDTPIASRRRATTLWRALGDIGLRVGTFNLPATYPPEPLSSFQVSGFDAPGFQPSLALPEQAFAVLRASVGEYELCPFSIQDPGGNPEALEQHADLPVLGSRALLKAFPCDVYMVSFQIVDWVHHGFLGREMTGGDPGTLQLDGVVVQAYQMVDERLGQLLDEWADDDTSVVVVSDHGGASADRLVNLEKIFLDSGLMAYTARSPGEADRVLAQRSRAARALRLWTGLKRRAPWLARLLAPLARRLRASYSAYQRESVIDWSRTRAAPWGKYAQIRLNLEGRDPEGIVGPAQATPLADEVSDLLISLRDPVTGGPVYREVLRNAQLYEGEYAGLGPDLYALPTQERYLTVSARSGMNTLPLIDVQPEPVTALDPGWGVHSALGILAVSGPEVRPGVALPECAMADVTPTVLYLLDQPIPHDLDGRPLLEAVCPETVRARPVRTREPWARPDEAPTGYSDEERRQVERRLRQLGYM